MHKTLHPRNVKERLYMCQEKKAQEASPALKIVWMQ